MWKLLKNIKPDYFVLFIFVAVVLAYFFPQLAFSPHIPLKQIISIGITLIFFFYGLKLRIQDIKKDLNNARLHVLIQLSTFLLFPLLVLVAKPFIQSTDKQIIWLAFMFLAALPSTVSSSVVMVSIARGNVPASIFNATISGLIGIVLTPLWMGLFVSQNEIQYDWGPIYAKLLTEILVPVILGIVLQYYVPYFHNFTQKFKTTFTRFDQFIILLIVYESFAASFKAKVFSVVSVWDLSLVIFFSIALFYIVYFITGRIAKVLRFNTKDTITLQFSGTKKSLLHGTVFSEVIFGASAMPIGIILLPIMIFHAFQLFAISVIATRKGARIDDE